MIKKIKFMRGLLLVFLLLSAWATKALAESYAVNAVMLGTDVVNNENNAPLASGLLEIISFEANIIGPTPVVPYPPSAGEMLKSNPGTFSNWGELTFDSLAGGDAVGAGHFKHQISAGGPFVQNLIVRAWNAAHTKFGESMVFQTKNPEGGGADINQDLSTFSTTFDPTAPSLPGGLVATPTAGSGITPPKVTISFNSVKGARWFEMDILNADGSIFYHTTIEKSYHVLYSGAEGALAAATLQPLNNSFQGQTLTYRVKAHNSFGESAWATATVPIPLNADPTIPVAVTNLIASYSAAGNNIALTWTPPYDENASGALAPCTAYDIRVSREALTSAPVLPFTATQTNPGPTSNWDTAIPLTDAVGLAALGIEAPTPPLLAPDVYGAGTVQNLTVTGSALSGTYFFAIKSHDAADAAAATAAVPPRWSYISNVAGVQVPAPEATRVHSLEVSLDPTINDVVLSWATTPPGAAVDVYSSLIGPNSGYTLAAGITNGVAFDQTAANIYYRVVPTGWIPIGGTNAAGVVGSTPSETVGKKTFTLTKITPGYGINMVSLPYSSLKGLRGTTILNANELLTGINNQQAAGADQTAITMFGYWDALGQRAVGYTITYPGGVITYSPINSDTPAAPAGLIINPEQPYQFSVNTTISFVLGVKL